MSGDDRVELANRPVRVRGVVVGIVCLLVSTIAFVGCQTLPGGESNSRSLPAHATADAPRPSPTQPPVWERYPDSLAAVGDSITRAFDACSLLSDCPKASWATGTGKVVDSLAQRLLERPAEHSWNLAETGATMAELPSQMARAATHEPELVTVMAGGNDACRATADAMTPVDDFRASFREALRTLWREAPDTQVYVASVPNLKRLWSQGRENPLAVEVWELGDICQSMLRDPHATGEAAQQRRERVQKRVRAYNSVLRDVCADDPRCRYDGGAVFRYDFTSEELSKWDWFHPSKEGQHELAELAYRHVTAPQAPQAPRAPRD